MCVLRFPLLEPALTHRRRASTQTSTPCSPKRSRRFGKRTTRWRCRRVVSSLFARVRFRRHLLTRAVLPPLDQAPTGSGKTVLFELAVLKQLLSAGCVSGPGGGAFTRRPGVKAVYIAPLLALVSERKEDWERRFGGALGLSVVSFAGDAATASWGALRDADIVVSTPEKCARGRDCAARRVREGRFTF